MSQLCPDEPTAADLNFSAEEEPKITLPTASEDSQKVAISPEEFLEVIKKEKIAMRRRTFILVAMSASWSFFMFWIFYPVMTETGNSKPFL